jgi:hypothetical protein
LLEFSSSVIACDRFCVGYRKILPKIETKIEKESWNSKDLCNSDKTTNFTYLLAFKRAKILTLSSSKSKYTEILEITEEINFMFIFSTILDCKLLFQISKYTFTGLRNQYVNTRYHSFENVLLKFLKFEFD